MHQREEKETILNDLKEHYHFDFNQSMKMILIVPTLYMNRERPEENFRAMSVKHICMGMVDSQEKESRLRMMRESLQLSILKSKRRVDYRGSATAFECVK